MIEAIIFGYRSGGINTEEVLLWLMYELKFASLQALSELAGVHWRSVSPRLKQMAEDGVIVLMKKGENRYKITPRGVNRVRKWLEDIEKIKQQIDQAKII